jgi:hypothetical protein
MPTASAEMTAKLVTDFATVKKVLDRLQDHLKSAPDAPSAQFITAQQAAYDRIAAQIDKWGKEVVAKPPAFPDEEQYKLRRKDVTKLIADVGTTAKVVEKEKAAQGKELTVKAVAAAKGELLVKDAKLAQALAMVARGEKGRAGPKQEGVKQYSHIHVGGNAMENLLFQPANKLVLGVLKFHLENGLDKGKKDKIKNVASRSGATITLKIDGNDISEA